MLSLSFCNKNVYILIKYDLSSSLYWYICHYQLEESGKAKLCTAILLLQGVLEN